MCRRYSYRFRLGACTWGLAKRMEQVERAGQAPPLRPGDVPMRFPSWKPFDTVPSGDRADVRRAVGAGLAPPALLPPRDDGCRNASRIPALAPRPAARYRLLTWVRAATRPPLRAGA